MIILRNQKIIPFLLNQPQPFIQFTNLFEYSFIFFKGEFADRPESQ